MKKTFMGVKLRKLRSERGLTQQTMAQTLGISTSYLNQLEQNHRPLTVGVLLKIHRALGVDIQQFSEDEDSRLIAGMREALMDAPEPISLPELKEVAAQMPALGHALVALHRRHQETLEKLESLSLQMGDDRIDVPTSRATPFEVVRDFFFSEQNYFERVDRAAEALAQQAGVAGPALTLWLEQRLAQRHRVHIEYSDASADTKRHFDAATQTLTIARHLDSSQRAFQLATQLALIEYTEMLDRITAVARLMHDQASRRLARIGLANYFAGAFLLPYRRFLDAAERHHYDIELLGEEFGVGFETVCHRLSTLQRSDAPGVPFFFVRVDRAGNISKRQSATHFHFSRTGGTCPLWTVYEAFELPERILTQLARMPDGRTYLWISRTVSRKQPGFGAPQTVFSVGLGCDIRHAPRLVYSKGLNLKDLDSATPIGMGCKVCERKECRQRAFPFLGRRLLVDENQSRYTPYGLMAAEA